MLIDEVELHLHPAWQQRVLHYLCRAFPMTQIIATTHSPQVVSAVERKDNVFVIDPEFGAEPLYLLKTATQGVEAGRILAEVFGVDERPQFLSVVSSLNDYMELVQGGQGESDKALKIRKELDGKLGSDDPDLKMADALLARDRWRKSAADK